MQNILDELKERQERVKNFLKQEAEANKNLLGEAVKQIFEDNKDWLTSFAWTQYTPYFNDGDVCEFSVYTYDPEVNGEDHWDLSFLREFNGWGKDKQANPDYDSEKAKVIEDLKNLINSIEESTLKSIFGDHVKVIITKDGFEVEDYDHD